jgi:hypothetical protein
MRKRDGDCWEWAWDSSSSAFWAVVVVAVEEKGGGRDAWRQRSGSGNGGGGGRQKGRHGRRQGTRVTRPWRSRRRASPIYHRFTTIPPETKKKLSDTPPQSSRFSHLGPFGSNLSKLPFTPKLRRFGLAQKTFCPKWHSFGHFRYYHSLQNYAILGSPKTTSFCPKRHSFGHFRFFFFFFFWKKIRKFKKKKKKKIGVAGERGGEIGVAGHPIPAVWGWPKHPQAFGGGPATPKGHKKKKKKNGRMGLGVVAGPPPRAWGWLRTPPTGRRWWLRPPPCPWGWSGHPPKAKPILSVFFFFFFFFRGVAFRGGRPPLGQKWGGPATPFFGQGVAPATPISSPPFLKKFFLISFFFQKKKKKKN